MKTEKLGLQESSKDAGVLTMNRFLRIGLPLILVAILLVVALFVMNAFEATALMETEKRAGPTILNR